MPQTAIRPWRPMLPAPAPVKRIGPSPALVAVRRKLEDAESIIRSARARARAMSVTLQAEAKAVLPPLGGAATGVIVGVLLPELISSAGMPPGQQRIGHMARAGIRVALGLPLLIWGGRRMAGTLRYAGIAILTVQLALWVMEAWRSYRQGSKVELGAPVGQGAAGDAWGESFSADGPVGDVIVEGE